MSSREKAHSIAVYGTLKQGERNYKQFLDQKIPIFEGSVNIKACLYTIGPYPLLLPCQETNSIFVEIFEINNSELQALDDLEKPYNLFRQSIYIESLNKDVDIYIASFTEVPDGFSIVKSGNWQPT